MSAYVVLVTLPDAQKAQELARTLVDERLAACVSIVSEVRSIYRWQGAVQEDAESLCVIKTSEERFAALKERILSLHPYEVPEVIALPVVAGHAPYLDWLASSVKPT
jgi:periplasmic divalent cation tolerance protein